MKKYGDISVISDDTHGGYNGNGTGNRQDALSTYSDRIANEEVDIQVQFVVDRYNASIGVRKDREAKWDDFYRRYLGTSEREEDEGDKYVINETKTIIRTALAALVSPYLDRLRPIITAEAEKPEGEAKSKNVEGLIAHQFRHAQVDEKLEDWFKLSLIYDAGFVKTYWDLQVEKRIEQQAVKAMNENGEPYTAEVREIERLEIVKDGPGIEVISPYDFFFDPGAKAINGNSEPSRYCGYTKLYSKEEIIEQAEDGWFDQAAVDEMLIDLPDGGSGQEQEAKSIDLDRRQYKTSEASANLEGKYEVIEYWDRNHCLCVCEKKYKIRHAKNPHPYLPFVPMIYNKDPHQLYGNGAVEDMGDLQDILNDLINLRLKNIRKIVNKMYITKAGALPDEEIVFEDGGIIELDIATDLSETLMPIEVSDVTASSFQEQQNIQRAMQAVTAATEYMQGISPQMKVTATEVQQKSQASSKTFDYQFRVMSKSILEVARHFLSMAQRYMDENGIDVQVEGPNGQRAKRRIKPEDIEGEFEIVLVPDPLRVNEQILQELVLKLLDILQKFPNLMMHINERRLIEKIFDIFNFDKTIMKTEEELANEQQQAMQQQQANTIQFPGGASPEAGMDSGFSPPPGMGADYPAVPQQAA